MPRPGKLRTQLMPTGLSRSCSALVRLVWSAIAPLMTSLAGALCTPRVSSLRAHTPATCPDGGTNRLVPVAGSKTLMYGQYSAAYFES